ncbi:hypothetical protein [Aeoliella mucimassa]|nr:hypothetical protein [Aeoliella mucimassa]
MSNFIQQVLADKNTVELSPRELAMFETHLLQSDTLVIPEGHKQAIGESEQDPNPSNLSLIRNFDNKLELPNSAADETVPMSPQPLDALAAKEEWDRSIDFQPGFLGGVELAESLGIAPERRQAFLQKLMRWRVSLGDGSWHEVRDPRPNSPRYLYRADSPKILELAAAYRKAK